MRHYLFAIFMLCTCCSCFNSKNNAITKSELRTDTIAVDLSPNIYIKTIQYVDGDSLKGKVAKEQFYCDSILIKEVYKNYITSEFDGYGDGEYQYFYNKNKKMILKYFIESPSGDSIKYIYKYFTNKDSEVTVYDFRRRLKPNMPHGDIIEPEDLTEKRIWLYDTKWINSYDGNNNLIRHYEINKNPSMTNQNLYTYKFSNNKLIETKSFINDSVLYWSEKYNYSGREINMIHDNIGEKDNSWILPFYSEKIRLDNIGNKTMIERFDNKGKLMLRYENKYDLKNRLVKMECYNEESVLKLRHVISYELIK